MKVYHKKCLLNNRYYSTKLNKSMSNMMNKILQYKLIRWIYCRISNDKLDIITRNNRIYDYNLLVDVHNAFGVPASFMTDDDSDHPLEVHE